MTFAHVALIGDVSWGPNRPSLEITIPFTGLFSSPTT